MPARSLRSRRLSITGVSQTVQLDAGCNAISIACDVDAQWQAGDSGVTADQDSPILYARQERFFAATPNGYLARITRVA